VKGEGLWERKKSKKRESSCAGVKSSEGENSVKVCLEFAGGGGKKRVPSAQDLWEALRRDK